MEIKDIFLEVLEQEGLPYKVRRGGDSIMVSCPFHNETVPSCDISLTKGVYHCFGCGRGGRIREILEHFGIEDVDLGGLLKSRLKRYLATEEESSRVSIPWDELTTPLEEGSPAWNYLSQRGVLDVGLRFGAREGQDFLKGRVVFPLSLSDTGEEAMVARWCGNTIWGKILYGKSFKRYLYHPPGARISHFLFGTMGEVTYLVEGVFDALKLISFGVSAVAALGCQLHAPQCGILLRNSVGLLRVIPDGDGGGDALLNTAEQVWTGRMQYALLKEDQDPGELTYEEFVKLCWLWGGLAGLRRRFPFWGA